MMKQSTLSLPNIRHISALNLRREIEKGMNKERYQEIKYWLVAPGTSVLQLVEILLDAGNVCWQNNVLVYK